MKPCAAKDAFGGCIRKVGVSGALVISLILPVTPTNAATSNPSPSPTVETQTEQRVIKMADNDVLVVGVSTPEGFQINIPADSKTGGWSIRKNFYVEGMETSRWIGYVCTTGTGKFAAVTFAPTQFVNRPAARDRGAFGAILNLENGDSWTVPERVGLKYHSPGCGANDDVVFTRNQGKDQQQTDLLRVNARTSTLDPVISVAGQITSAVPVADQIIGAAGNRLTSIHKSGVATTLTTHAGQVFSVHPTMAGDVSYMTINGPTETQAVRFSKGKTSTLAKGSPRSFSLHALRDGVPAIVGRPSFVAQGIKEISTPEIPDAVSLDGSVYVETVDDAVANPDQYSTDEKGNAVANSIATPKAIRIKARSSVTGEKWETTVASDATLLNDDEAPLSLSPPAGVTPSNTSNPVCAVARNDLNSQVLQPNADQVQWAANLAVAGKLTNTRPSNWMKNGLPSYKPQAIFPRTALVGGGQIPAQVVMGVLAQESNFYEASYHALPGVSANPLIGDYYGVVYDAGGSIIGRDYDDADCGYGIGQITDHMTLADSYYTASQKKMIATDYAANIAVVQQVLASKWNTLQSMGVRLNNNSANLVENWFLALWGYNSGIYPNLNNGTPWGVGWTNNPANADYPPERLGFLRASYADAAHPGDWSYQEKVMGWAERPLLNYKGEDSYEPTAGLVSLPPIYKFCVLTENSCSPTWIDPNPSLSYCTRADRKCWWHTSTSWTSTYQRQVTTYFAGDAEPPRVNPYPASCSTGQSIMGNIPDLTALPSNAVVVDDVPDSRVNLAGCNNNLQKGSFAFSFGVDGTGLSLGEVDLHQLGVGLGGHSYFTHVLGPSGPANKVVTGTWTPPASVTGWQRIFVHTPNNGADTFQADYKINIAGDGKTHHRMVNQQWEKNTWTDLGSFNLTGPTTVSLSNTVASEASIDKEIDISWDAVAFVKSAKPKVAYVAMGDSYSAGEGAEPYFANSDNGASDPLHRNKCHRSASAYSTSIYSSLRATYPGKSELHFLACSGAIMANINGTAGIHHERPALEQGYLDENTTHVTLSIGGNDARFAAVLLGCIATLTDCLSPTYKLTIDGVVDPAPLITYEPQVIDAIGGPLGLLVDDIKARAPNAVIELVGYPHVVAASPRSGLGCDLISDPEQLWFNQMGDRLVGVMSTVAASKGIRFGNPVSIFTGHEACTPDSGAEWINATILFSESGSGTDWPGSGSFHPKAIGQLNYATPVWNALR